MAYASWSVVFGEQPSAAKWNILGTNDSSFNDGTGFAWGASAVLTGGATTSWTPTWTSSGSAPSIGNGTLTGKYQVIGKMCFFRIKFVGGAGTTWGTGNYFITLPVAGYSGIAANDGFTIEGYAEDNGVLGYNVTGARMNNASTFYIFIQNPASASAVAWAATTPFTWGTGDYWSASGFYEVA